MVLKEIRRVQGRPRKVYLYYLMNHGLIPKHVNERGYVCYDPAELRAFKRMHKKGRPAKQK